MNRDEERLAELEQYSILDSTSDEDYNDLTVLASEICNTPISLITMVDRDRQWFKSHHGLDITETPIEHSFCAHAIQKPQEPFFIQDAREDERFSSNPLVTGDPYIVFYAGVPLVSEGGTPLGTLCVIDRKPRNLTTNQKKALEILANQVMKLLSLRKTKYQLRGLNSKLEHKNQMLKRFAKVSASQIKSPLKVIEQNYESAIKALQEKNIDLVNTRLDEISGSAKKLSALIDGLLSDSQTDYGDTGHKEPYEISDLKRFLVDLYPKSDDYQINFFLDMEVICCHLSSVKNIFLELVSNSLKHNDKAMAEVDVGGREYKTFYEFYVSDNGPGLASEQVKRAFEAFTIFNPIDRYGEFGVGIGLTNVKKLIQELGGDIEIESQEGEGVIITFTIKK